MSAYNHIAGQKMPRMEALADGVFAIAMTILVFDLKLPPKQALLSEAELWQALVEIGPKLLTFFLSFLTLAIFWTGHSTQLHFIKRYDRGLNWISIFFLMFASVLPFTTSVLSANVHNRISIGLYWLNVFALGALLYAHWHKAYHRGYIVQLIDEHTGVSTNHAIRQRIVQAQLLYGFGALLCFLSTYASILFIIAVQLNYATGMFEHVKKQAIKEVGKGK